MQSKKTIETEDYKKIHKQINHVIAVKINNYTVNITITNIYFDRNE